MSTSTLTSKGQITLPKQVRERLGLRQGDRVVFELDEAGSVRLMPVSAQILAPLFGRLHQLARASAVSVGEMEEAIRQRMRTRHPRRPE